MNGGGGSPAPRVGDLIVDAPLDMGTYLLTAPTIDLTGGQMAFPAVAVPSADANTLDDYEEGTWAPSVGGTATYAAGGQIGLYTKIGNTVFFTMHLEIALIGTGDTNTISGLPFNSSSAGGSCCVSFANALAANVVMLSGRLLAGTKTIRVTGLTAAGSLISTVNVIGDSTAIELSGQYQV